MAYSFPMALTDFFAEMPLMQMTMQLSEARISSGETGAGEILTATMGVRLWGGTVSFQPMYYEDAVEVAALVSILEEPGSSFFVNNPTKTGPRSDPDGTILASATPKISSINANNRDMLIKSLPNGYVLSGGDELSFAYGSNPTRYAFHRVVKGGTANGAGQLNVELSPRIRSGAVADIGLTLINPVCKAIVVPGSFDGGTYEGNVCQGMKFSWQQTLR